MLNALWRVEIKFPNGVTRWVEVAAYGPDDARAAAEAANDEAGAYRAELVGDLPDSDSRKYGAA